MADASCYMLTLDGQTSDDTCQLDTNDRLDRKACTADGIESCSVCTSTVLPSNPSGNCIWFGGDDGFCGHEFNPMFTLPGTTTGSECPSSSSVSLVESCDASNECFECVDVGCSWTGGMCMNDCDLSDAACFNLFYFVDQTAEEICLHADHDTPTIMTYLLELLMSLTKLSLVEIAERNVVYESVFASDDE